MQQTERSTKRRDLLDGAVSVFAEDGYSRATIDGIARRAGVSSRTIYNQYRGKAELFQAAIVDSANHVATAQIATLNDCLGAIGDAESLRTGVVAFARAWAVPDPRFARHFALVRQVRAEAGHIPTAAVRAWQEAGPRRVHAQLTRQLTRIAAAGLLRIDDAATATDHLIALATAGFQERQLTGAEPSARELGRLAEAAAHTFLHGHAGRS